MRRNRTSLIDSDDAASGVHRVRVQDFVDACDAEIRLGRDANTIRLGHETVSVDSTT